MSEILKAILVVLVLAAGVYDLRYRRIPNWLNLSGLILGFGLNVYLTSLSGLSGACLGFFCALAVYVPLYLLRGMGAGDVKLMAAIGAIAGPHNWLLIFAATAIAGGVIGLVAVASKNRVWETAYNVFLIVYELCHFRVPAKTQSQLDVRNPGGLRLPHGIAIAFGSLIFVFAGALIH